MSNYPMVDEVNRLVGNLLAAGSGVFLPGVGSLFVERRGARRLSKRSVQPPCRVVSFSSQQQGVSLADELARTLHCDAAGAQDVYDRWLSRTREGDVLTIEGVGVLKFKNFTLAPAFDRLLNPQGHEPVRIKPARRLDWALWGLIVFGCNPCGCQTCRTASRVGGTGLHGACIARFGTPVCRVGGFQYAGKCGPCRRGCRSQGCIGTLRGLPFRQ